MSQFDFYGELQALIEPNSVYAKEYKYQLETYIDMIINELVNYFKEEHKPLFVMTIKAELNKVLK